MALKIGAHFWIWAPKVSEMNFDIFTRIQDLGFDALEIPVIEADFPIRAVKDALSTLGLEKAITAGCFPNNDPVSKDATVRARAKKYLEDCIKVAAQLDIGIIGGPIYAAVGKWKPLNEEERIKELKLSADTLRAVARTASDFGVLLAIEPVNRYDNYLINTSEEGLNLVKMVGSESVGLMLDTFHMNIEERSFKKAIKTAGRHLYHLHTSESNRGPPGDGVIDWRAVALSLKEVSYPRLGIIESFTLENAGFATAMKMWKPTARTPDELARRGLRFLREIFQEV